METKSQSLTKSYNFHSSFNLVVENRQKCIELILINFHSSFNLVVENRQKMH